MKPPPSRAPLTIAGLQARSSNLCQATICDAHPVGGIALAVCASTLPAVDADATLIDLQFVQECRFRPSAATP